MAHARDVLAEVRKLTPGLIVKGALGIEKALVRAMARPDKVLSELLVLGFRSPLYYVFRAVRGPTLPKPNLDVEGRDWGSLRLDEEMFLDEQDASPRELFSTKTKNTTANVWDSAKTASDLANYCRWAGTRINFNPLSLLEQMTHFFFTFAKC